MGLASLLCPHDDLVGYLVYIYKGRWKDIEKVAPGTATKGHILWGWNGTKFENRGKVFHDNILYKSFVSDPGQSLVGVRTNRGSVF